MSLSDVMGAAGLTSWAEVGLVISVITFLAIAAWVLLRRKSRWEHVRRLPLDHDDTPGEETKGSSR